MWSVIFCSARQHVLRVRPERSRLSTASRSALRSTRARCTGAGHRSSWRCEGDWPAIIRVCANVKLAPPIYDRDHDCISHLYVNKTTALSPSSSSSSSLSSLSLSYPARSLTRTSFPPVSFVFHSGDCVRLMTALHFGLANTCVVASHASEPTPSRRA